MPLKGTRECGGFVREGIFQKRSSKIGFSRIALTTIDLLPFFGGKPRRYFFL
jgi:hypothetical protein